MNEIRIWLSRPHMGGAELDLVKETFDSNFIAPVGPMLSRFETIVSDYLGGDVHCLALSSGTAAMHLALMQAGVKQGDEVWTNSMTFGGGVFPVNYIGAELVFFDISDDCWSISIEFLESELLRAARSGALPAAIIPTDLYGMSVNLEECTRLGNEYGVKIIVDSAESLGADYKDQKAGVGVDSSILSFNGNKIITTSGGGMFVSKNEEWVERARYLSTQARQPVAHYEHIDIGYNYRMSNVCAAIGVGQMEVLDQHVSNRRKIFDRYKAELGDLPGFRFMAEPAWSTSSRWLSTLTIDSNDSGVTREDIRLSLSNVGIETRPLWKPMHLQPLYLGKRYVGEGRDEKLFSDGLCLPSGSDLTEDEQTEVIERIQKLVLR